MSLIVKIEVLNASFCQANALFSLHIDLLPLQISDVGAAQAGSGAKALLLSGLRHAGNIHAVARYFYIFKREDEIFEFNASIINPVHPYLC